MIDRRGPLERDEPSGDWEPELLLQPETRPISHEQLVIEVKGIYAGLVMVEAKCIDIDERQSAAAREQNPSRKTELLDDQWQSLIALHKQLLHEHHDFFLASQHPSAGMALSRLAAKYSMPARMWRHGIHAFLEVLRHRLPDSLEHMLAFIYIAYSMMALLYETVPALENTWIECLGDFGKYRIAIDEDGARDREIWSNVANSWYNKASDKSPHVGRLYHHMAILARPYTLEQLSLYVRALTCTSPPMSARASIMSLFAPVVHTKIDYGESRLDRHTAFRERTLSYAPGEPLSSEVVKGILCPLRNNPPKLLTGPHIFPMLEDYAMHMNTVDWLSNHWRCPRTLLTPDTTSHRERRSGQESWHAPGLASILWLGLAVTPIYLILKTVHVQKHAITLRRMYHDVVAWSASLSTDNATSTWVISRRICHFRRPTILAFVSLALPSAGASPIGKSANAEGPTNVGSFPFAGLGCFVFALAILFVAQYLAPRKGPICVWGYVMAGSAYSWLMVRNDPTTTLALSAP